MKVLFIFNSWAEDGVDPALYSKEFVLHATEAAIAGKVRNSRFLPLN